MNWVPVPSEALARRFTTESRQKRKALFLETHLPIDRIWVAHSKETASQRFTGEQELLQWLNRSSLEDANRVFLLSGETGSGKSELCQWLEYHLERPVIHVARSQSTMAGLMQAMFAGLPDLAERIHTDIPAGLLLEHLAVRVRLEAARSKAEQTYIQEVLSVLPQIAGRLNQPQDRQSIAAMLPRGPLQDVVSAWIIRALRESLGLESLELVLHEAVRRYLAKGVRPVLLMEDITTLGFLRDELMDFLFDLSFAGLDAVIGVTTGFEAQHLAKDHDPNQMAYVRERLVARLSLSTPDGSSYFLHDPSTISSLVKHYLRGLVPPNTDPVFNGLYPFREATLTKIFALLVESGNLRQTPRVLLEGVIKPTLASPLPPYLSLQQPNPSLRTPAITFNTTNLTNAEIGLLYWYGDQEGSTLGVSEGVMKAFGLSGELRADLYSKPPLQALTIIKRVDRSHEWEEALRQLQQWLAGQSFPKRQVLKQGIARVMEAHFQPRLLDHPSGACAIADPLLFARGGEEVPIWLEDSGDVPPPRATPSLKLERGSLSRLEWEEYLNYAFAYYGPVDTFSDPVATYERAKGLTDTFQQSVEQHLEDLTGLPHAALVLGAWGLLRYTTKGDLEAVTAHHQLCANPAGGTNIWEPHLSDDRKDRLQVLARTTKEMMVGEDHYYAWLASVFFTRETFLDANRLGETLKQYPMNRLWEQLAAVDLMKVSKAPYRQRGSKWSLAQLLTPVVEHCRALGALDPALDLDRLSELGQSMAQLQDLKAPLEEALSRLYSQLEEAEVPTKLGAFPPVIPEGWPLPQRRAPQWQAGKLIERIWNRQRLLELRAHPVAQWMNSVERYLDEITLAVQLRRRERRVIHDRLLDLKHRLLERPAG